MINYCSNRITPTKPTSGKRNSNYNDTAAISWPTSPAVETFVTMIKKAKSKLWQLKNNQQRT